MRESSREGEEALQRREPPSKEDGCVSHRSIAREAFPLDEGLFPLKGAAGETACAETAEASTEGFCFSIDTTADSAGETSGGESSRQPLPGFSSLDFELGEEAFLASGEDSGDALLGVLSSIVQDGTDASLLEENSAAECEAGGLGEGGGESAFLNTAVSWILSADALVEARGEDGLALFTFPDSGLSYKAVESERLSRDGREGAWKVALRGSASEERPSLAVKRVNFDSSRGLPGWLLRTIAYSQQQKLLCHPSKEGGAEADEEEFFDCLPQLLLPVKELHVGVDKTFFLLKPGSGSVSLAAAVLDIEASRRALAHLCNCSSASTEASALCAFCDPRVFAWLLLCALERLRQLRLAPLAFSPASVYLRSLSLPLCREGEQGTTERIVAALSVSLPPAAPDCTPQAAPEALLYSDNDSLEEEEDKTCCSAESPRSLLPDSAWTPPEMAADDSHEAFLSPSEAREAAASWGVALSLISLLLLRRETTSRRDAQQRPPSESSIAAVSARASTAKRIDETEEPGVSDGASQESLLRYRRNSRRRSCLAEGEEAAAALSSRGSCRLSAAQRRRRSCGLPEGLEWFGEEEEATLSRTAPLLAAEAAESAAAGDLRPLSQPLAEAAASSLSFLQYDASGHLKPDALLEALPELKSDAAAVAFIQRSLHANPRQRQSPREALGSPWLEPVRERFAAEEPLSSATLCSPARRCAHCLWMQSFSRASQQRAGEARRLDGLLRDGLEALALSPKKSARR